MSNRYKKRPVVIEAVQYDGNFRCLDIFSIHEVGKFKLGNDKTIIIPTLEGDMTANVGDYIIRGTHGEYYPCKAEIFEANYEKVED